MLIFPLIYSGLLCIVLPSSATVCINDLFSAPLFCFVPFSSVLLCFVLFRFVLFCDDQPYCNDKEDSLAELGQYVVFIQFFLSIVIKYRMVSIITVMEVLFTLNATTMSVYHFYLVITDLIDSFREKEAEKAQEALYRPVATAENL